MHTYRGDAHALRVTPGMSRKGNCFENAEIESFFCTLKAEISQFVEFDSATQLNAGVLLSQPPDRWGGTSSNPANFRAARTLAPFPVMANAGGFVSIRSKTARTSSAPISSIIAIASAIGVTVPLAKSSSTACSIVA